MSCRPLLPTAIEIEIAIAIELTLTEPDVQLSDAEQAQATVETDREVILGLIRDGTGFERFNRTIRDALRHSFELVAVASAQRRL